MATTQVFDNEVQLEIDDGVALLTFIATEGQFEWGTPRAEHRLNHVTVGALLKALDAVEAAGDKANVKVSRHHQKRSPLYESPPGRPPHHHFRVGNVRRLSTACRQPCGQPRRMIQS